MGNTRKPHFSTEEHKVGHRKATKPWLETLEMKKVKCWLISDDNICEG